MPGTHQHASHEGVALVHTLYGDKVGGTQGINDSNPDVQPAGMHSSAPYRPPKRRRNDNPKKLLCSYEDCKAYPMKEKPYCAGHMKKMGLANWEVTNQWTKKKKEEEDVDDR